MTRAVFVDTNVLLRFLLGDHENHSPRAHAFFESARDGSSQLWCSSTVVFEVVFILERNLKKTRSEVGAAVSMLVRSPMIRIQDSDGIYAAAQLYVKHPQLSFADCFHAALALESASRTIATFDKEFDRVEGLIRIEPPKIDLT